MNRRPEPLADLLPGVVADLAARHHDTNGAPPMTLTVWRFELALTDRPEVAMPRRAELLSVGPPRGRSDALVLWAVVDPTAPVERRQFVVVGTGNPMPSDAGRFVGTAHSHGGRLIWHVFEAGEQPLGDAA